EDPPNLPARCFRAHPPSPMSPRVRPPAGTLAPSSSLTPSPSLSDSADVDASQPLVFPELPTNSTPSRLGARNGSQRGPAVAQASGPPFSTARSSGRASNATARSPAFAGRRAPCHRNAAAWCIGTCLAFVQTISLPPRHPCTCTPQTKNWRNLHRVATKPLSVHSTCWQSLITLRSRPPLPLNLPLDECIVNTTPHTGTGERKR